MGFVCEEDGNIYGELGYDIATVIYLNTGKENVWPIEEWIDTFSEVDMFTVIEFLYDYCSEPTEVVRHGWQNGCIHVRLSNDDLGKKSFREALNPILKRFKNVELSNNGEIYEIIETGLETLIEAVVPSIEEGINKMVETANKKFRRAASSIEDRRDALRDLADILENLRPKIKGVLMSKDENELFMIANNFGIRHFNKKQKDEYDKPIWHSWIFYCYLATIHACVRLIEKQNGAKS